MEIITIKIKNKTKVQQFLEVIKELDYIEIIGKNSMKKEENKKSENDFFSLAGMWENRDISSVKLRAKTWPKGK